MNKGIRYTIIGICSVLLAAGMTASVIAGQVRLRPVKCTGLEVTVLDSMENGFVSRKDVRRFLDKEYGSFIGESIDSIDLVRIEDIIDGRSAVKKSQAFVTRDGILHINVTQRKPVVRFQKKDGGFYADAEGYIFPLQNSFASHVQIIDGEIPLAANSGYKGSIADPKEREWFRKVMEVVNFIGNVEARQVPLGDVDVVVCDGFSGNVLLKSIEGTAMFLGSSVSAMFKKNFVSKLAAMLVMKDIKAFKKLLDYREIGGTQFLGIKKPVIKAHGSSDARAFYSAVRQAVDAANNNTAAELEVALKQISAAKEKA